MSIHLLILAFAVGVAGDAVAEPPQGTKSPDILSGDPNERICETIPVLGSRLGKKRFCGTRAEWALKREQDRHDAERMQGTLNGSMCVPVPTSGKTTC